MAPAVRFIVRADFTIPGQHIVLSGGSPVVGDWVLTAGPPLCTDQSIFPIWTTEPVDLGGVALPLTYKYVVAPEVHDGVGGVGWEVDDTATVRTLTVEDVAAVQATAGGDVLVVDDGWFGVLPRAPVGGATASGATNGHAAATVAAPSDGVVDWAVHTPTAGKLQEAVAKAKPTAAGSDKGAASTTMGAGPSKEGAEHGKGPLQQVGLAISSVFSNAHDAKPATHDETRSTDGREVVERTNDATGGNVGTTATGRSTATSADESSFNVRGGSTGHSTGGTQTTTITSTWSYQSSGGGSSSGGGGGDASSAAGAGHQGSTVVVESNKALTGSTHAAEAAGTAAGNVASSAVSAVKESAESAKQSAVSALGVAKAAAADVREAADGALGDARSAAKGLASSAKGSAAATWDAAKRTAEPVKATVASAKASLASARSDSDVTAADTRDASSSTVAKKAVTGVEESRVASSTAESSATSTMQRVVDAGTKAAADSAGATKAVAGATDTEKAVEGAADASGVAGDERSDKASATKTKTMTASKTHQAAADSKAKKSVTHAADAKKVGGTSKMQRAVVVDNKAAADSAGTTKAVAGATDTKKAVEGAADASGVAGDERSGKASATKTKTMTASKTHQAAADSKAKKSVTHAADAKKVGGTSKMQRAVVVDNKAAADSAGTTKAVAGATDTKKAVEGAADASGVAGDERSGKASATKTKTMTASKTHQAAADSKAKKSVTHAADAKKVGGTSKMQRAVVVDNKAAADSAGTTKAVAGTADTEKAVEGAADASGVAGDERSGKASATKTKTMTASKTHQAAADSKAKKSVTHAADAKKVAGSAQSKGVVAGVGASMDAGARKVLPKAVTTLQPTVTNAKEAGTGLTHSKTSSATSKTASTTGATASTTTAIRSQHVTNTNRANLGSTDAEKAVAVDEHSEQSTAAKLHQAAADARSAVTSSSRPKKYVTWSVTSGARTAGGQSTVDAVPVTLGPATGATTPPHGSQRQSSSKSTYTSRSSVSSVSSFTRSSRVSSSTSSSAAHLPTKTPMSGTSTASFFSSSFSSSRGNKGAGLWHMPAGKGGGFPTVTETVKVWEVDQVARAVLPAAAVSPATGGAVADAAGTLERLAADGDNFLTPPSVVVPFGIYTAAVAAATRSATATTSLANLSAAYEAAAAGDDAAAAAEEACEWIESSTTVPRGAMAFIQAAFPRDAALLLYPSGNDSAADGGAGLYGPPVAVAANDPDSVAAAVRRVWGSLWSPAAAAARAASGVPHERAAMAVLVQAVVSVDALFVAAARSPGSIVEMEVAAGESADSAPFRGIVGADGAVMEEAVDTGEPAAARVEPPRPSMSDKSVAARLRRDAAYRAAVFRRIGAVVTILEGALGAPQVLQGALHGEGELYVVHARSADNV